jgi:hypothetical protein
MHILHDAAYNRYLVSEAVTEKDLWNVLQRYESKSCDYLTILKNYKKF